MSLSILTIIQNKGYRYNVDTVSLDVCVCVCVCVCGLVRTYIRGQFCVFNHLTGDVRQVGTSPDVFPSPINFLSHFEHV